jgi:hypothetical protein
MRKASMASFRSRHAAGSKPENTARDFNALKGLAGGGENLNGFVRIAPRGGFAGHHVSLQRIEPRGCRGWFRYEIQFQPFGRSGFKGLDDPPLKARAQTQIDEQEIVRLDAFEGKGAARGVVGKAVLAQRLFIGRQQQGEIGTGPAGRAQCLDRSTVESQVFEGAGEGARKSWKRGDGSQVGELGAGPRRDLHRDRLPRDAAHGCQAALQQRYSADREHEIAQRVAVDAGKGAAGGGAHHPDQIVGGFARRAEYEHRRMTAEKIRAALQQHVTGMRCELHGPFRQGAQGETRYRPLSRHHAMIRLGCKHIVPHLGSSLRQGRN